MKVSGFILTAIALTYLYLWRSGNLGALAPAPEAKASPAPTTSTAHHLGQVLP